MLSLSQALGCDVAVHLFYAQDSFRVDGRAVRLHDPIHARAVRWVRELAKILPMDLVALEALVPPHQTGSLNPECLQARLTEGPSALQVVRPLWAHGAEVHARTAATLAAPVAMGPVVTAATTVSVRTADRAPLAVDEVTRAWATAIIDDAVSAALLGEAAWLLVSGVQGLILDFRTRQHPPSNARHLAPLTAASSSLPLR